MTYCIVWNVESSRVESSRVECVREAGVRCSPEDCVDVVECECGPEPLEGTRVAGQAVDTLQQRAHIGRPAGPHLATPQTTTQRR